MTPADPLEIVPLEAWDAPAEAAVGERAVAALAGHMALEQTFHLPVPLHLLARNG